MRKVYFNMTYTNHTRDQSDRLVARMRRIYGEDAP